MECAEVDVKMEEDCILRQRKEKKDLQARIQQLKHAVPKGDKKKKKEVAAQVAILESELDKCHEEELKALKKNMVEGDIGQKISELNLDSDNSIVPSGIHLNTLESETDVNGVKKTNKAQRRKEKKVKKTHEREERIKEQDTLNEHGSRSIEAEKLNAILRSRGLVLSEVPSDGNCLFSAIEHQLQLQGVEFNVETLRHRTAEYIRSHRDDFWPFLVKEDTGDLYSPEEFDSYCDRLASTPEWGGQAEIRALAEVLKAPIEVVQADVPSITVGENFQSHPLTIVYHRHQFGLGEHYNSVRPAQVTSSR